MLGTIAVLSAAAVSMTVAGRQRRTLAHASACCLLALAAAEGIYNNTYPSPAAWDIFRHPAPYIRLLQTEAGSSRVFAVGAPYANTNEAFRISTLDSLMAFNPPRMFELYSRYAEPTAGHLHARGGLAAARSSAGQHECVVHRRPQCLPVGSDRRA